MGGHILDGELELLFPGRTALELQYEFPVTMGLVLTNHRLVQPCGRWPVNPAQVVAGTILS